MTSFLIVRHCCVLAVPVICLNFSDEMAKRCDPGSKVFFHFCNIHVTFSEYNTDSLGR